MIRARAWLLAAACAGSSLRAEAQQRFDVEAFEPAPAATNSVVSVYGAHTLAPGELSLIGVASYAPKPLSLADGNGRTFGELVGSVSSYQLLGAIGLAKHVDFGFALPVHRVAGGSEYDDPPPALAAALMRETKTSFGDVRLVPRVSLLSAQSRLGVALLAPMSLPTGKRENYAGESFRIEPRVALDYRFRRGALLAFNAGYLVREETRVLGQEIDDMVRLGTGAEVPIAGGLSVLAEVNTQLNVQASRIDKANAPTEGLLGLRFQRAGWIAQLGAGPGMVRGLSAPRYRLFASIGWSHRPAERARERDVDRDGIPDTRDRCPAVAEDLDGFQDADGCPDDDDDGDGVVGAADRCPSEAEDRDQFEDDDGCPERDDDQDGLLDLSDACPREAEDRDGFQDEDGCPDRDNDGDGVLDADDRCPEQAGPGTPDGCPAEQKVVLTGEQLELREPVFFAKNRALIEARSDALLDAIADVLQAHPELLRISVQGHTDATGKAARNRKLSKQRADAVVKDLIARGVEPARLSAEGVGSERPIASNETSEGRAQNRRVELHILERASP